MNHPGVRPSSDLDREGGVVLLDKGNSSGHTERVGKPKGPAWLPWRRPSRPPKVEPLKQLGSEQQQISKKSLDSDQGEKRG